MSIRIQGTTVIDDSRNASLVSINLNNTSGDSVLRFGPGVPSNDDAHIEWKGGSNGGYLRLSTSDDNGTEYIEFGDYDNTNRGGAFTRWGLMNRNYFTHTSDVRSPIFYDSNNTSFYVNPASQSNMNTLTLTGNRLGFINSSFDAEIRVSDSNPDGTGAIFEFWGDGAQNNSTLYSEIMQATVSMRSPIFYDRNNTAYYTNPASTSVMNEILVGGGTVRLRDATGNYGSLECDGGGTGGWEGFSIGGRVVFMHNNASNYGIYNDIDNEWSIYCQRNAWVRLYYNGGQQASTENGYFIANNQMRAPIYYDSNNTSYYMNPASTSYVAYLGRRAHQTGHLVGSYNSVGANSTNSNPIYTIGSNYNPASTSLGNMYGIGYTNDNASFISFTGNVGWGMYVAADGDARIWLDGSAGNMSCKGASYSPIHYDYNNTAYYVNPASTSVMNEVLVGGGTVRLRDATGNYGSLECDGGGTNGWEGFSIGGRMVFMHNNSSRVGVYNDVDNEWCWYYDRNSAMRLMFNGGEQASTQSGYFLANNQIRSPIYYDSNNTGYYVNPASTSILNELRVNAYIRHNGDTNTYIRFIGGDDMQLVAGGRQMIRMDEGGNPDRLYFPNGSTYTDSNGNIVAAGNVTAYASDERLKTNIEPIEDALEIISEMTGVYYDWVDEVEELGFVPDSKEDNVGVLAQEVQEVLPQVVKPAPFDRIRNKETDWEDVSKSGEEYLTVDYDKIVPVLIEGIKELHTLIEDMNSKHKQEIDQLRREMGEL